MGKPEVAGLRVHIRRSRSILGKEGGITDGFLGILNRLDSHIHRNSLALLLDLLVKNDNIVFVIQKKEHENMSSTFPSKLN